MNEYLDLKRRLKQVARTKDSKGIGEAEPCFHLGPSIKKRVLNNKVGGIDNKKIGTALKIFCFLTQGRFLHDNYINDNIILFVLKPGLGKHSFQKNAPFLRSLRSL